MGFVTGEATDAPLAPVVCYSALINKAWECVVSKDDLWCPVLSTVNPTSRLSGDIPQDVCHHFSYKGTVRPPRL